MANIKNIELLDNIRTDALLLMKENPNLDYLEAYKIAKEQLISDSKITEYVDKPFSVEIQDELLNFNEKSKSDNLSYDDEIKELLKDKIDISGFTNEQLKQLAISTKMEIDITKIADKKYSPEQIKVLAVMMSIGKNIDKYIGNYDFKPSDVWAEI